MVAVRRAGADRLRISATHVPEPGPRFEKAFGQQLVVGGDDRVAPDLEILGQRAGRRQHASAPGFAPPGCSGAACRRSADASARPMAVHRHDVPEEQAHLLGQSVVLSEGPAAVPPLSPLFFFFFFFFFFKKKNYRSPPDIFRMLPAISNLGSGGAGRLGAAPSGSRCDQLEMPEQAVGQETGARARTCRSPWRALGGDVEALAAGPDAAGRARGSSRRRAAAAPPRSRSALPVAMSDGMQPSTTLSTNTAFHSWPLAEWIVDRIR